MIPGFRRLSPQTVYQRFFTHMQEMPSDLAQHFANVDHTRRQALIAELSLGISYRPVGIARYELMETEDQDSQAEVALLVFDEYQNKGVGHVLFHAILNEAAAHGIGLFCADVLAENRRMIHLIHEDTSVRESKTERGVTHFVFTMKQGAVAAQ